MKKLMMVLVAVAVAFGAWAETETVGGYTWTYRINGDTAEIYNNGHAAISPNPTGPVTIPSTLGGKPITSIGHDAFYGCSGLTSVTIPNSVTSIGDCAFRRFSGLTSVTIPDSVTSIGQEAFSGCSGLTSVTIPDSVTNIGYRAFYGCSDLTSVAIPDSVTSIGSSAFFGCSEFLFDTTTILCVKLVDGWAVGYTDALSGDLDLAGIRGIGPSAFESCSGLTSVTIPDSVTSIGDWAFENCSGLTSVTIPDSVTSIGVGAFDDCSELTSVTIPDSVTSIGSLAFRGCNGLTSVYINDLAKWCGISFGNSDANPLYYAHNLYLNDEKVTDLVIPDDVTSIGSYAFSGCGGLTNVTIPDNVTSIGAGAFANCNGFTNVVIGSSVASIGDYAFSGCSELTSVTIPDSVTSIGDSAFSLCSGLTSVMIPNSVTNIGWHAFSDCSGLTSVTIPDSVTSIGAGAFSGCSGLKNVTVPQYVCERRLSSLFPTAYRTVTNVVIRDGVTNIGNYAFDDCSGLTSVTIPDSVTSIGDWAFENCSGLTSVYITDLAKWCGVSFGSSDANPLYYAHNLYLNGELVTDLVIPDGVTSIGNYAFYNCSELTSVTIPDSVTSIGNYAFNGCSGLRDVMVPQYVCERSLSSLFPTAYWTVTNVVIRDGVTNIGYRAFSDCSGLTSVTIPDSVTRIGDWAFENCSGLTSVYITDLAKWCGVSFGSSDANPLYYAHNLYLNGELVTDLAIPASVTRIRDNAFSGCSGLTSVTIPDSVTSIGSYAFRGCSGLTSVTIPDSVTSIGSYAFSGCGGLTNVTIPDSVTDIGASAFSGCSGLTSITLPFVGSQRGNSGTSDSVFGYIFGTRSYAGGMQTYQYYFPGGDYYYIPTALKTVTITDETALGCGAFYNCSGLTSVTIPDSVTSIGRDAFYKCNGLFDATAIPGVNLVDGWVVGNTGSVSGVVDLTGVRGIGDFAFSGCSGLTGVLMAPAEGMHVGADAFDGCSGLVAVGISDLSAWCGVKFANAHANPLTYAHNLYTTKLLKDLVVPDGVDRLGDYVFSGCNGLTNVTIPNSVTNIGNGAFSDCSGLTSVTIPDSVTSIGWSAFSDCSGLKNVTVPQYVCERSLSSLFPTAYQTVTNVVIRDGVTNIGNHAFYDCSGLTSVTIPGSVTSIGGYAFYDCSGLTSVTIPDSVTSIEDSAFKSCSRLKSVTIPDSVMGIGSSAFMCCSGLTSVTIPDSVTSIGSWAFAVCSGLTSVTIPDSVTGIGSSAFAYCSGLTSVTIPDSVTSIGDSAFAYCSELTSVTIPDSVTNIGEKAFRNCSNLKRMIVPISVTNIAADAFSSCSSLNAVYILGNAPTTGGGIYKGTPESLITYVTEGSKGWVFAGLPALPEKWPTTDGNDARKIVSGDFSFVDVAFDANGGELVAIMPNPPKLAGVDAFGALSGAIRDGYVFLGWFTAREGGERVSESTVVTADMTALYAHWGLKPDFEMGGNSDWTQETDGSWRSGAIGSSQTTWMETTVYGEGEVSFRWKVSSYSSYGKLYFYVDGIQKDYISGEVGWTNKTFVVSSKGAHTLKWAYSKTSSYISGNDCGWIDAVAWNPYVECTVTFDAAGGDLCGAAATRSVYKGQPVGELPMPTKNGSLFSGWWTEGDVRVTAETVVTETLALTARWEVNPFMVGAGSNWAQNGDGGWESGATAHNATNSILMSVSGAGTVTFDWKTSCEGFYRAYRLDYLAFFIDGVEQGFINGITNWTAATFDVAGLGNHTLTWSYIKDSEGTAGSDCAWLRDVTWTPSGTTDVVVEIGGKSVSVPGMWLSEHSALVEAAGGDVETALKSPSANGRLSVVECYVLGLDPENGDATNDFRIVSFPMKADGTPDLANVVFEPPQSRWNVPGARAVIKGAAALGGEWREVTEANKSSFRFFKVEVELP